MPSPPITNLHGRRPGRGVRPWLLIPKLLAVCVYIGGLATVLAIWFGSGFHSLPAADPKRLWTIDTISWLMIYLVVPGLLVAIGLGIALFFQNPGPFVRTRWLQVKLVGLAILIPSAHLFCSSRLGLLRRAYQAGATDGAAEVQIGYGLTFTLAGSMLIVVLARLKPRLGQRPGDRHPSGPSL